MSCIPEPPIQLCDNGQRKTFVWQLSIDHNMSNNKLNMKSMQYVLDFQLASVPFHIR